MVWNVINKENEMTSEQALRRIRQRIFDYPEDKEAQADRVLAYLKKRMLRNRTNIIELKGQYSGLTKRELVLTGTCETDWY